MFNFDDPDKVVNEVNEQTLDNPSMSALINEQMHFEDSMESNAFDDTVPTICAFRTPFLSIQSLVDEQLNFEFHFNKDVDESHVFSINSARTPNDNNPPIQSSVQAQPPEPVNVQQTNPPTATIRQSLLHAIRSFHFRHRTVLNHKQEDHSSTTSATTHVSLITDAGTIT